MNRRKFLKWGGIGLAAMITGGAAALWNLFHPSPIAEPVSTEPATSTPTAALTPEPTIQIGEPTPSPASPTSGASAAPQGIPALFDDFTDPLPAGKLHGTLATDGLATRMVAKDSSSQLSTTKGSLRIRGLAPSDHDPLVFSSPVPCADGQVCGARFKIGSWKNLGNLGVLSAAGAPVTALSRTGVEAGGGVIHYGARSFPVLNLYSQCWYDLVVFSQAGQAVVALNDGAGLELVMVSDQAPAATAGEAPLGYLGYSAIQGDDQDASIDFWYKTGEIFFPQAMASNPLPPADFEADLGENAAWVEAQITHGSGSAGLRIRSLDHKNEYRIYLDRANLKVDHVIAGDKYPVSKQPVDYRPGAKLAARFNELTLTVYYADKLVGTFNQKIGAPDLVRGTKTGIYSSGKGNLFTNFKALPVRLGEIEALHERLLAARRVLCLGDSLTNGDKAYGYQNQLRKSLGDGWVTIDAGVSGQITGEMLARLSSHLDHYHPEIVIVLGGINDIRGNLDSGTIKTNLQAIYSTGKRTGAQIAAVTILPFKKADGWTEGRQSILENVNAWIMGQAGFVDRRIDAYAQLEDPGTKAFSPEYAENDHLHLNGNGYAALANAIYQGIR